MRSAPRQSGFALIITLALLALLVLAVLALSALVKVGGQVSSAGTYQVQARQNALLGLNVGFSELQRHAGTSTRVTAMAGITGIAANASNNTRHWCGVWRNDGSFVAWLASGAQASSAALQTGVTSVEMIGQGSVGAAAANSEHVIAGRLPIVVVETPGAPGSATTLGNYAYAVSDEGVKTSVYSPGTLPVTAPLIFSTSATNAQGRLRDAVATYAASLSKVAAYEQLSLLPTPGTALTPSVLQDNFHHATLTSRFVGATQLQAGSINLNTNSAIGWRNILQTYNSAPGAPAQIASATLSTRGTTLQNNAPGYSGTGKLVNGPFTSLSTATVTGFLATAFTSGSPTAAQIATIITPMLTVRSDTFRIRAYGEALHPVDSTKIEAAAYCEAIVQRTLDTAPNGLGNRFVVTYFRWLGPDDI